MVQRDVNIIMNISDAVLLEVSTLLTVYERMHELSVTITIMK